MVIGKTKNVRNEIATKEDLSSFETRIRDDMSYKLTSLETRLRQDMATKADLETAVAQIIEAVDKSSADKGEVSHLKTRVDRIEDHLDLTPLK